MSAKQFIYSNENRIQPLFDANSFVSTFNRYIINGKFSNAPEAVVQ